MIVVGRTIARQDNVMDEQASLGTTNLLTFWRTTTGANESRSSSLENVKERLPEMSSHSLKVTMVHWSIVEFGLPRLVDAGKIDCPTNDPSEAPIVQFTKPLGRRKASMPYTYVEGLVTSMPIDPLPLGDPGVRSE